MGRSRGSGLILAVDQSTSATKAVVFDTAGTITARASREHTQYYPRAGWVEHDPEELYANTLAVIEEAVANLGARRSDILSLALTNQRETVVAWERGTGKPVARAAVWQCQRGAELCARLKEDGNEPEVRRISGLPLDPYFSASKVTWMLDNLPGLRRLGEDGKAVFGTIDSWLVWCLTRGAVHVTDPTNASRTMLMNLSRLEWDDRLLSLFRIPRSMAPVIGRSDRVVATTRAEGILDREVPIAGLLGDSHAAFFAQRCFHRGDAKATYGTGTSLMMNTGSAPVDPGGKVVASVGWATERRVEYVLEGNIHSTGDTIAWLRDGLGVLENADLSEAVARSVPDSGGTYFVPAFSGLGAPYWDPGARAAIVGMGRGTTRAHIVRAALEAIAYQVTDLARAMERAASVPISELRVDGGATRNELLVQFQADILGTRVVRSAVAEASALGAALMAGLAVGAYQSLEEIPALPPGSSAYVPSMRAEERDSLLAGWHEAVRRTMSRLPPEG